MAPQAIALPGWATPAIAKAYGAAAPVLSSTFPWHSGRRPWAAAQERALWARSAFSNENVCPFDDYGGEGESGFRQARGYVGCPTPAREDWRERSNRRQEP